MPSLFVDHLTVVDCALLHPQRGLVGTSWIADVRLEGELDAQGMLFDFGPAKRRIKEIIDQHADHKLIVAQSDARITWQQHAEQVALSYTDDTGATLTLQSPAQAFCILPGSVANAGHLSQLLQQKTQGEMPANVKRVHITLRDEVINGATYSYCHGLRQHGGNCQRMAHGHRSRIKIFANGQRSHAHEQRWAELWQDIYLGTRADLANNPKDTRYRFAYTADQGQFQLELDANRCALLDAESTVENIAAHIAAQLKSQEPNLQFIVHAYEGVNKGAIAQSG